MNEYLVTIRTTDGLQQKLVKADSWWRKDGDFHFNQEDKEDGYVHKPVFRTPADCVVSIAIRQEDGSFFEAYRAGSVPWPLDEGPRILLEGPDALKFRESSCYGCGIDGPEIRHAFPRKGDVSWHLYCGACLVKMHKRQAERLRIFDHSEDRP